MGLLTREERKTLSGPEKRALRKQRRTDRQPRREPVIDWKHLEREAKAAILDMVLDELPGDEKMDEVLDGLAEDVDEWIKWDALAGTGPIGAVFAVFFEWADGLAIKGLIRALVRPSVQRWYDQMKAAGDLTP